MKQLLPLILILCSSIAMGQETLIIDKVKPYAWNSTVPAVIFRSNPNAGLPLVIYCHGTGEIGSDGLKMWKQGLPLALKNGFRPPYPIVAVAPQFTSWMNPNTLPYIIQDMYTRYGIDTNMVYVTGVSAGGFATWGSALNISEAFASKIAAIVPLSASYGDANQANMSWFKKSKIAVWAIAGGSTADPTELSFKEGNITLVNKVNMQVPGLAKMTVRPGLGHCCWEEIYNGTWKENGTTIWDFLKGKKSGGIVVPPVLAPVITSSPAPFTMYVNDDFFYKMVATNNPTRWDAFPLPLGLKIDSLGQITGKPTVPANVSTSVTATNSGGSGSKVIQFVITARPKEIDSRFTTEYFSPSSKTEVILYKDSTYSIRKL